MTVITPDACEPTSEDAAVQVPEEDLFCDRPVVSELALISVRIDIFQALTMVFD